MRIAVCADEADVLKTIKRVLQDICKNEKIVAYIDLFSSTDELLESFMTDEYSFDLVLLYMGTQGMKATECAGVLRRLNNNFKLVFLTSYEIRIYDLFQYNISSVIPIFMPEKYMSGELTRILRDIENYKGKYLTFEVRVSENNFAERKISISDILYMTVVDRKIYVRTLKEVYTLKRRSFTDLKKLMFGYNFIEISRFYIVNMEYVRFIKGNEMRLDNGTVLTISRRQLKNVTDAFSEVFELTLPKKRA